MPYRFRVAVFARTTECPFLHGWAYDPVKVPGALHRIADGPGNKVRGILLVFPSSVVSERSGVLG